MKLYRWVNYWLDYWWDYHITRFRFKKGHEITFYRKVSGTNKVAVSTIIHDFRQEATGYERRYNVGLRQTTRLESGHVEDDVLKDLVTFRMRFKRV